MGVQSLPPQDEWQRTVDQFKTGKKGGKAEKHAAVLISLLNSSAVDLGRLLPDFSYLPSGVVGRALNQSYSNFSADQRTTIWEWMSRQKQDRQDAERTYALPGVIRADPDAALTCLLSIRATTKEQKERLVSFLAEIDGATIASLFTPTLEEFKARKVIQLLLTAADGPYADERVRETILEGILPPVRRWRLQTGAGNFRAKILDIFERLPAGGAARIGKMLPPEMQGNFADPSGPVSIPELNERPQVVTYVSAPNEEPVTSDGLGATLPRVSIESLVPDDPIRIEYAKTSGPPVDQFAWLDAVIQVAALPQSYYLDIRQQLERGEQRREELQRKYAESQTELATAHAKIQQLQSTVDQVSSSNDAIQRERHFLRDALEREQQASASLQSSLRILQESEQTWGRERDELARRINDHADKTLADFKVALSFAISPLVKDLPDMASPRLAELAPNLRVIIRQILGALADKGVEIRGTAGVAR